MGHEDGSGVINRVHHHMARDCCHICVKVQGPMCAGGRAGAFRELGPHALGNLDEYEEHMGDSGLNIRMYHHKARGLCSSGLEKSRARLKRQRTRAAMV